MSPVNEQRRLGPLPSKNDPAQNEPIASPLRGSDEALVLICREVDIRVNKVFEWGVETRVRQAIVLEALQQVLAGGTGLGSEAYREFVSDSVDKAMKDLTKSNHLKKVGDIAGWNDYLDGLSPQERKKLTLILNTPVVSAVQDIGLRMQADARRKALAGGGLLSAEGIGEKFGVDLGTSLRKWSSDRTIFSVEREGKNLYPAYALDPDHRWSPYPVLKDILEIFRSKVDWSIAIWFASVNSFLAGSRPQDLLSTQPDYVRNAAEGEMVGPAHG